jgi:branched-chain amino acid aminotransferase
MPAIVRLLTDEGLLPAPYTADSLADAAAHEPRDGVYSVANTFQQTRVLKLDAHLDRMENSARLQGQTLILDRQRVRRGLRDMIEQADFGDVRFRVTWSPSQADVLILTIEPFKALPPETYAQGVRVITVAETARANPAAKSTEWMIDRKAIEDHLPPGIFTAILVGADGLLLEGVSSNFYGLLDGVLHTALAGVLPGIAQQIVLEIARDVVPIRGEPVSRDDVPRLTEAFITSASRGIVPVVEIDGHATGSGVPGPITQALRSRYLAWVSEHLEEL